MPGIVEFKLDKTVNTNMGSVFHGYMMERIDPDYATKIHDANLNPYSQCVYFSQDKGAYIWRITCLDDESYEKIILRIKKEVKHGIYLKDKDMNITVTATEKDTFESYRDIVLRTYRTEAAPFGLSFITPVAFKSQGEYVFIPTTRLICQSIVNKVHSFSNEIDFDDKTLVSNLEESTKIVEYSLKSTKYYVEKVKIDSFKGQLQIRAFGPDPFRSLINTILSFAPYTGMGIKTSLGMGGTDIV